MSLRGHLRMTYGTLQYFNKYIMCLLNEKFYFPPFSWMYLLLNKSSSFQEIYNIFRNCVKVRYQESLFGNFTVWLDKFEFSRVGNTDLKLDPCMFLLLLFLRVNTFNLKKYKSPIVYCYNFTLYIYIIWFYLNKGNCIG